jgi:transcriptional regulator with XRE-family HTH domain
MSLASEKRFLDSVGRRIAETRKEKHITQETLASKAGLDRMTIALVETGMRRPSLITIYKISKALDVKVEYLFREI